MIKVSFITVSWNVRELIERCLSSIFEHAKNIEYEIIVIDNASIDGSERMIAEKFPSVTLIINKENRGFGAACNQGIATATGDTIFLLNPDSQLENGTLEQLVSYMDTHADVGVCAPQIKNADGSIQYSVRRFPTPLSQIFVLLKLRRFAPRFASLKKYFALDFDYSKDEQEIDQPMGAAMLIRARTLSEVGVFDERFYLWFDEVDLCKRIRDAGWKIIYCARARVIHQSGKSFAQTSILERQKNFFRSCGRYLRIHCGAGGNLVGAGMAVFAWSVETAQMVGDFFHAAVPVLTKTGKDEKPVVSPFFSRRIFSAALAVIVVVELLSFLGYLYAPVTALAFGFVMAGVFLLSTWRLEYGVAALFAELIIGSKGYLLSITVGSTTVPLRMGIFAVILAAWIITETRIFFQKDTTQKTLIALLKESRLLWWYLLIVGVAIIGVINGIVSGNSRALVYSDSNAWIFFIIAPCVYRALTDSAAIRRLFVAVCAGVTAQIVKVLFAFYVMGHKGFGVEGLTIFYRWIRSTGVGEITQLPHLYRIFFQSQIYIVIFLCVLAVMLAYRIRREFLFSSRISFRSLFCKPLVAPLCMLAGVWASLILSFSRSFWLGTAVIGLVILIITVWKWWRNARCLTVWIAGNLGAIAVSLFLLFAISLIPLPSSEGSFAIDSLSDRVKNVQDEAAAASRWNLLPVLGSEIIHKPFIGYGFGKTVTYVSRDPRVLLINPSGEYTTYAFEWGYLDMLVKLGFLGLLAYLLMIRELFFQGIRALKMNVLKLYSESSAIISGLMFGVSALLVVHIFTPYLNHPLGIGFIIFSGLIFERLSIVRDNG
ncbi:MAG: glycosyltransferase [Candidatus Uhrbacteria bacterium]|nr:glycosyltransferase [Candidatus Uhrbacteria bacterium]